MTVWVVTRDFYLGKAVHQFFKRHWPHITVLTFYRVYAFETCASDPSIEKPVLILTDGTCRIKDEYGQSIDIWYEGARLFGRQHRIPIVSPSLFGKFFTFLLRLKLARYASRFMHRNRIA